MATTFDAELKFSLTPKEIVTLDDGADTSTVIDSNIDKVIGGSKSLVGVGTFGANTSSKWHDYTNHTLTLAYEDLDDILNTFYTLIDTKFGYKTQLPTALHINADWSFTQRFYVNLNTDLSLISKKKATGSRISNIVSLTPRFESKFFSLYVPLSVVEYNGFQAGAGLRFGGLYIGSGSILTALTSNNTKGADGYAGLKFPIYQ